MGFPVRIEKTSPADSDNPSAGAAQIRDLKEFIEDYFNIADTVSYTVSPFDPEVTGRINVKEYPYNAKGDGVTDDGDAIIAAAVALQANGGGTLFFPPGTYRIYTEGTTYFGLASFTGLTGVSVIADGATLAIDPARVFTVSVGTMFTFSGCENIIVDGFTVTGPTLDITSSTVKGVEFCRFTHGCHGISMPNNSISNCIAGAIFSRVPTDAGDLECTDIDIGIIRVNTCWYGVNGQYSGSNMRIGLIDANTVHRSFFVYGANSITANINQVDQYAVSIIGAYGGYGCEDIRLTVRDNPSTKALQERIGIYWQDQTPAAFRNITLHFDIQYGDTGDTGGPALQILKYTNAVGYDIVDRGHVLENLTISGLIDGVGSTGSYTGLIATSALCTFGTGDFWKNICLRDLIITNNTTQHVVLQGASITGGLLIDNVQSTAEVWVGQTTSTTGWVTSAPYTVRASSFPNMWVTNTYFPMCFAGDNANFNIPLGLGYGGYITNRTATQTCRFTLPAAALGLNYYIRNATADQVLQIAPAGTDRIGNMGSGDWFYIDTPYTTVHLFCHVDGIWDIMSPIPSGEINVRMFGAVGDGVTDDTAAIQSAIDAAAGTVYFPTGIYAISDTITLRNCTEILGPAGGGYYQSSPASDHLNTGYGAGLKWIGAASGTMVSIHNIRSVKWSGVDLDGMDVTDDVKGFVFSTDNTLSTTQMRWQNFRVWNCGDAITIGSAQADINLDMMSFADFSIWICNNGFILNSGNIAGTTIRNGNIGIYKKGVNLIYTGFATLESLTFASLQEPVAGDAFIVIGNTGELLIKQTQGEPHPPTTTSKHILFVDGVSVYTTVTMISNVINWGVDLPGDRKVLSIGNQYDNDVNFLAGGGGILWESHSDWYATGKGIVDAGTNNIVHESMPFYTGGVGASIIERSWFNNGYTYQRDYTGTVTAPGATNYIYDITTNVVDLGISVNGLEGGNAALISCSANIAAGDLTISELFLVRFGYDGDNVEQESIKRSEGAGTTPSVPSWTFSATAGHTLGVKSSDAVGCKYKILSS